LSKRSLIEFNGFYNKNNGDLNKKTYDINGQNGKYDILNDDLSNAFRSEYTYTGGGLNFRSQQKKITYGIGATIQYASLLSNQKDNNSTIKQNFTNVLPSGNLTYSFSRTKNLQLEYSTSTQQPTTAQLQPVQDINDPLNIREGNPNLKQHFQQNVNLNYFAASPLAQRNFFAYVNFSTTQNAIVNSDVLDQYGARITSYKNVNGVYNLFGGFDMGFPLKKIHTRFSFGTNTILYNSYNFLNGAKNNIKNIAINPRTSVTYTFKEKVDIAASARFSYNEIKYSLEKAFNDNYWRNTYELEANINLLWNIAINNELTYTSNTGRSQGFNRHIALWNASITKGMFKYKRGTLKLSVYDLLNQNIGISRNANLNFIEDARYTVLNRFYMLSFTYSLNKAGNGGPQINIRMN
ncbi:MAG: outer membrane beta-barrel protein, partial [Sphingobacteriales bacterium]